MPTIEIEVKNKVAKSPAAHIVCGNSDYEIKFLFDAEWSAHNVKTARFAYNGTHEDIVFNGNTCRVPVIRNATVCEVGVYAGNLSTTTPALVTCDRSILCRDGVPADPQPDVYQQFMEQFDKIPFSENVREVVLLPETIAECGGDMDNWGTEVDFVIVSGETYIVEVDGTKYECVAEGGEPAYLTFSDFGIEQDSGFIILFSDIGAVTVTLKISHIERRIKKMDVKYIDMDKIKAALPTVEILTTLADGTTATCRLFGEVVG